jgi:hypothetical protein
MSEYTPQQLIKKYEFRERFVRFLQTRKTEETKNYTRIIIEYLSKKGDWVRARDIFNALVETGEIAHSTTFFRILKDLEHEYLIESKQEKPVKGERGKAPIYYRIPYFIPPVWLFSHEELVRHYVNCEGWLSASVKVLKNHPDIVALIEKEHEKNERFKKKLITEYLKSQSEVEKEAKERMKDVDIGPGGDMLSPYADLDKED